jgi:hypothetical protein
VNFGERSKSSRQHSLTSTVKPVLTGSLTKGWPRMCVNLVKGSNRVHWRGFRGDDPGWPRFDRFSVGVTRLIRSLAIMTTIKKLGRHNIAPSFPFPFSLSSSPRCQPRPPPWKGEAVRPCPPPRMASTRRVVDRAVQWRNQEFSVGGPTKPTSLTSRL